MLTCSTSDVSKFMRVAARSKVSTKSACKFIVRVFAAQKSPIHVDDNAERDAGELRCLTSCKNSAMARKEVFPKPAGRWTRSNPGSKFRRLCNPRRQDVLSTHTTPGDDRMS